MQQKIWHGAYPLHAIRQPMISSPITQKSPGYLRKIIRNVMQNRVVAAHSQFSKLQQMLTLLPRKHLQNTSHHIAGNVLARFSEHGGQHLHCCSEPIKHGTTVALAAGNSKHCPLSVATNFSIPLRRHATFLCSRLRNH
jgi:hypothetical protein